MSKKYRRKKRASEKEARSAREHEDVCNDCAMKNGWKGNPKKSHPVEALEDQRAANDDSLNLRVDILRFSQLSDPLPEDRKHRRKGENCYGSLSREKARIQQAIL